MEFKLGELFCGPGGLALGMKQSQVIKDDILYKINHVWSNDIDEDSCNTYRHNICPEDPDSVYSLPVDQLDISGLKPINAFAYGFPCNDFSLVGEKNGVNGKYGSLYYYGVKVLDRHNPLWFIAENVGGLQSANDGEAFKIIIKDLSEAGMGYRLTIHYYKFEEYGVPQTRHRIIIVGIRDDLNLEFKIPAPTTPLPSQQVSAKQALESPPIPSNAPNQELTNHLSNVVERLKHIPPGENAWYKDIPDELKLNVKSAHISQIYKRLHPDLPSYTVTGSGGGGTHVYHWSDPRALTNRERARLQTFPDDFLFIGGKESVRKQIGMAVPPRAARIIIESVLKTFAGIEYQSVPSKWVHNRTEKIETQISMEI